MDLIHITNKEEFAEFKLYASDEGLTIISSSKDATGLIVTLSDGETYHLPPPCEKWVEINTIDTKEFPYSNPLIYGKNQMENIVNISVKNDTVYIFQEIKGEIEIKTVPMKYWIISPVMPKGSYIDLKGNQYFKYMKEFTSDKGKQKALAGMYKSKVDKYTSYDHAEAFMIREGYTYFKGMKVEDVSILSFDIETNKTLNPKLPHSTALLISNTFRKNGVITRKLFSLDEFKNEFCMIIAWCKWVHEMNPSILTGHNINGFDLYYLHHRLMITQKTQIGDDDKTYKLKGLPLGRDKSAMGISKKESQFRKDGSQSYGYHKCSIFGRNIIDGFFVSIRYDIGRNFPSYGLKPIIEHLGFEKEGRIKWDFEKDDPNKIWEVLVKYKCTCEDNSCGYCDKKRQWKRYKEYCIDDSDDSLKVFDHMIAAQFYMSQNIPQPFQSITETASGRQINNLMIRGYLQQGYSLPKPTEAERFEGAISFGVPGVYQNVFKIDVASLYPSIMRQYKIYDKRKDPLKLFLELVESFTVLRLKFKHLANDLEAKKDRTPEETSLMKYYRGLDHAYKVIINSMYGFMGANGLHFNSPKNAALVTKYGRDILTETIKWATGESVEYWKEKI